jgi:hypothetical protein
MAANLSGEGIRVFRCPNCNEFINTSLPQCRFCGAAVDPAAADAAATVQSKLNAVCNDSSYARILAGTMWVMFFVSLIPFCGIVIFGAYFLFFAVPVVTARSWWRISALGKSEDPALHTATRQLRVAAIMWGLMFVPMIFNVLGTFMRR